MSRRTLEHPDGKFWEAWIEGRVVYTRFGKLGAKGQTKLKDVADPEAELGKQIAAKLKEGYTEGSGAPAPVAAPTGLEAAILADPYDDAAYSVLGDALEAAGDPRGQLVALQRAGKTAAAAAFLAKHQDVFLGPLAEHTEVRDIPGWDKKRDREAFHWANGFIRHARLSFNHYVSDWKGELTDVLAMLLAHPSARFLAELTLNYDNDPNERSLEALFDVLAKAPRPTIRKLVIGDDVDQISWYRPGNLSKLWRALPNLTTFALEAGEFTLGTIVAPHLKSATIVTGGLSKANAKSLAKLQAPELEELVIYFGDDNYGADSSAKDIAPLLARTDLPKLRHLALANAMFADALIPLLAKSPLLKQLTELDLAKGILTDDGALLLGEHASVFAHLAKLDLRENYLSDEGIEAVQGCAKEVLTDDQKEDDDPEYRFVSVGE